ncbi:MAG TPA: DNA repair protein RecO [Pseudogracilibacillus sp.]|nr:DNA repair protein RecO [Pseudogracilibacillus sp.]
MLRQVEGIVLKSQDYGETHKIITIFTKEVGKITAIARGANKPKSKLSAVSQVFIRGEYLVYLTKGLGTIQQGQTVNSHRYIREDIIKTAYAAYMLELTDKLIEEKTPDVFIYHQLQQTMAWMNEQEAFMIPLLMYEMKLFNKGGFAPVVDGCVNCGRSDELTSFSIQEGGVLCKYCFSMDERAVQLPANLIKSLSIFLYVGLERVGNISMKKQNEQLLRTLFLEYYDVYGGYYLKSRKFLKQIDLLQ